MADFTVHTIETAPNRSVALLEGARKAFGFVPNLIGVLAESPATAEAYLTLSTIFDKSSLNPAERQVAILAISRYNECDYCMAAHSVIASMQKVPSDVIQALRNDQPIKDRKLEALRTFATTVVAKRGWVSGDDVAAFLSVGYDNAQILEIILAASLKTLSNYANHVAETPIDDAFANRAWQPVKKSAA
jgi:uncharacterized peroxidase-related enzyme